MDGDYIPCELLNEAPFRGGVVLISSDGLLLQVPTKSAFP